MRCPSVAIFYLKGKDSFIYSTSYTVYDDNKDKWNASYILDFLVYSEFCKIVVECDGNTYHGFLEAKEKDLKRDIWIKRLGFDDTLRFNTEQIKYNLDGCIKF
ncbi:endonuclease domain-containing protein [Sporosarcina sp. FSL W7-1349]|uniref:endonuclease domain-containing protein n=1 Tax=Sporosarcina sp. FSL W7-1349 TaxID=2921561 RepID=UPI00404703E9